jgi:Na+-transporting NADH:ubiquinone oxidoreductase subunit C
VSRNSNAYIFGFASIVTIICAIILGSAATVLKPLQDENADVDKKTKVLMALGEYHEESNKLKKEEIKSFFPEMNKETQKMSEPRKDGKQIERVEFTMKKEELAELDLVKKLDKKDEYTFFFYKYYESAAAKAEGKPDAYVLPIEGPGLWDMCYGFLALEGDVKTVKGIIYYQHKETPGLGAKIKDDPVWPGQFAGKTFDPNKPLKSSKIDAEVKGQYHFSAISAATFTVEGVNYMLNDYTKIYSKFLGYEGVK